MKKGTIVLLILFLFACSRGVWVTRHVYRPKHPEFSILKKPFNTSTLINNEFLYVSQREYVNGAQNRIMYDFTGFYADGKVIGISLSDTELNKVNEMNSWKTAPVIGHYTTNENLVEFECFLPTDGGLYETRQGIIKKDTLFMKKFSPVLYNKRNRYDTLVVSARRIN